MFNFSDNFSQIGVFISLLSSIISIITFIKTIQEFMLNRKLNNKLRVAIVASLVVLLISVSFFISSANKSIQIMNFQNSFNDTSTRPPTINYSLTNSDGYWDTKQPHGDSGICTFKSDRYHITMNLRDHFYACYAEKAYFQNFIYQVEMQIIHGDAGGLIFRADITETSSKFYYLSITENGVYTLS